MFFPGETVTFTFVIPFASAEIDHIVLSYKQNEAIMLEKTITSGFIDEGVGTTKVEFVLTQLDSLLFSDEDPFTIQMNVYTINGTRHASHEMSSSSGIQYLRDVMVKKKEGGE